MIVLLLLPLALSDVYMHNPRGNNDRNCERNVNRNNGNRQFDSQNNAKGGYACPRAVSGTNAAIPPKGLTPNMRYEVGSKLEVEWTAQHGCGHKKQGAVETDPSVHCEMTIQMLCAGTTDPDNELGKMFAGTAQEYLAAPREGIPNNDGDSATNRIATTDPGQAAGASNGQNLRFGVHETPQYYNECNRVQRNRGLFTADQNVNRRSAIGTRQNPNGGRRGLECPEERDYYPYWRASPFIDVAYLVDDPARCGAGALSTPAGEAFANANSMCGGPENLGNPKCGATNPDAIIGKGDWVGNSQGYVDAAKGQPTGNWNGQCQLKAGANAGKIPKTTAGLNAAAARLFNRREWPNNAADCAALNDAAVEWKEAAFVGSVAAGTQSLATAAKAVAAANAGPECGVLDWSRANHLGNSGVEDTATRYSMTIPDVAPTTARAGIPGNGEPCILRLRYNMSSSDYLRATNASSNEKNGQQSPIRQDPLVQIGPKDTDYVQLALNTNQVARTFQDRSYIFYVVPKADPAKNVINVNVRGKRGNIVQTYPAVEYDFVPNELKVEEDEKANTIFQFQWIGSDYNPRRGCNDGEGGPYRGDANVANGLNANTQGSNQNSRMDRMTVQVQTNARTNYPEVPAGLFTLNGNQVVTQPNTLLNGANTIFQNDAQARAFADAKCAQQLQMTNGNGVYPKLVPQALTPLTGDEIDNINNENRRENHPRNCAEGNAISPYFSPENVSPSKLAAGTTITFMSGRNNNFSNRESKLKITVGKPNAVVGVPQPPLGAIYKTPQYADEEDANYTSFIETDAPPFDPIENEGYGEGAEEGCTQDMSLFLAKDGATSYSPAFVMLFAFIYFFLN